MLEQWLNGASQLLGSGTHSGCILRIAGCTCNDMHLVFPNGIALRLSELHYWTLCFQHPSLGTVNRSCCGLLLLLLFYVHSMISICSCRRLFRREQLHCARGRTGAAVPVMSFVAASRGICSQPVAGVAQSLQHISPYHSSMWRRRCLHRRRHIYKEDFGILVHLPIDVVTDAQLGHQVLHQKPGFSVHEPQLQCLNISANWQLCRFKCTESVSQVRHVQAYDGNLMKVISMLHETT